MDHADSLTHRPQFGSGYRAAHVTQTAVGHHQQPLWRHDTGVQDSADASGNLLRRLDVGLFHVDEAKAEYLVLGELMVRVHLSEVPVGRLEMDGSDIRR